MTAGHVFISHGSENRREAEEISALHRGPRHQDLDRAARRPPRHGLFRAAAERDRAMPRLRRAGHRDGEHSPYVRAETEMAFSNNKPIFPVRQSDIMPAAGLAFFLKIRHWTDAYGASAEASMDRLAQELRALAGLGPEAAGTRARIARAGARRARLRRRPAAGRPEAACRNRLCSPWRRPALLIVAVVIFLVISRASRPPRRRRPHPTPNASGDRRPRPRPARRGRHRPQPAGRPLDRRRRLRQRARIHRRRPGAGADGTEGAVWALNGDQLVVTTANGEQHTVRINSVDQSAIYSTDADGSVESSTALLRRRCAAPRALALGQAPPYRRPAPPGPKGRAYRSGSSSAW